MKECLLNVKFHRLPFLNSPMGHGKTTNVKPLSIHALSRVIKAVARASIVSKNIQIIPKVKSSPGEKCGLSLTLPGPDVTR